ncbi:hypothetical protein ES703_64638 [subsurface metagenome]
MRLVASIILLSACVAFGGVAFGINPIGPMPETYIGYKIGPVVPSLSLHYFSLNGSVAYREADSDGYDYVFRVDWKGSILTPTFGTKLVLGSSDLRPFARVSAGLPFLTSIDVLVTDEDAQGEIENIIEDIKTGLKQPILLTGGAGVEYFPVERFSIGGEFIYRYATAGFHWEDYRDYGDGDWERQEVDVRTNFGATSAGLWLNFYF